MDTAPLTNAQSNDHFQIIVGAIVAVIGLLIPVVILLIQQRGRINRTEAKVDVVRDQVQNDHPTNLREEADERHGENARKLDWLITAVSRLQGDVQNLYTRDQRQEDELAELHRTINPLEKDSPWKPSRPSPKPSPEVLSPGSAPRGRHSATGQSAPSSGH